MPGNQRTPPRFVPTLTTVVDMPLEVEVPEPGVGHDSTPFEPAAAVVAAPPALSEAEALKLEEALMHRVLQRIDLKLEEQLKGALSAAVQQQLEIMLPTLRASIEDVVRGLVVDALAQELGENPGSEPASGPESFG